MAAKYQVPLRDGKGGMMDVTVKGQRVIDASGKDIGPVKMFPGLKKTGEGSDSPKADGPTVLVAPAIKDISS